MATHDAEIAGLDALEAVARPSRRLVAATCPRLAAVALAILAWQVVVWTHWRPSYALPGPLAVAKALVAEIRGPLFFKAIGVTLVRAAVGYALALALGSALGIAVAQIRPMRAAVGSLITGLQTMPSIAWFPLAILLFKLSEGAILFVVVLGAAPAIANGLIAGVDHIPPLLQRAGRVIGARGLSAFRHVVVPAALPYYVAGLKQGWAFAWRSLMAGELIVIIARRPSIGVRLAASRELSDVPTLMAWMIVILVIGLAVDVAFSAAERGIRSRRGLR